MDMHSDGGAPQRRLAHVLLLIDRAPGPPPFRSPPPPSAATAAEFRVAFRGWLGAPRHWELWVAKLRPIHERLWRELGIFDAVLASTYRIKRDASAVLHLASFWSPSTSTFVFPWGEATITLEDVAVLGGFPADGSPVPAPLPPQWRPDEAALNGVRLGFNRSACKKAHHAAWMKHFLTDTGMDAVTEHAAFLALWLTRFVLPESTMRQSLGSQNSSPPPEKLHRGGTGGALPVRKWRPQGRSGSHQSRRRHVLVSPPATSCFFV